jgi:hypothetical protein
MVKNRSSVCARAKICEGESIGAVCNRNEAARFQKRVAEVEVSVFQAGKGDEGDGIKRLGVMQSSPTIGAGSARWICRKRSGQAANAELHQALLEYKALFFCEQSISGKRHVEFARKFGGLEVHPFAAHLEGHSEVLVIGHGEDNRVRENTWRSDVTWRLRT